MDKRPNRESESGEDPSTQTVDDVGREDIAVDWPDAAVGDEAQTEEITQDGVAPKQK